ncbi:hypothetical protein N8525_04345 [Verrucomicrobiales bacterium]|nr:hypothetical protein [Verrucomicrobiales bacterium]
MRGKRGSAYLRWTFDRAETPKHDEIFFDVKCGDGFAACINGKRIASSNTPAKLSWNSKAEDKVNDGRAMEFRSVILESCASALKT